jgi:hypothetical protein
MNYDNIRNDLFCNIVKFLHHYIDDKRNSMSLHLYSAEDITEFVLEQKGNIFVLIQAIIDIYEEYDEVQLLYNCNEDVFKEAIWEFVILPDDMIGVYVEV